MPRGQKKSLGDFGEYVAADFLEAKGYEIVARNFLVRGGELDLVARTKNWLVFVEVKTRQSTIYGLPSEAINYQKQQHMLTAANAYLTQFPSKKEIRFDVVEVLATTIDGIPYLTHINHIENIVMEGLW